jgi:hypothetical protein
VDVALERVRQAIERVAVLRALRHREHLFHRIVITRSTAS